MLRYPNFDPIAFSLGPIDIRWYGISYVLAFVSCYWLYTYRAKKYSKAWSNDQISDLLFYVAIGIIFGGRMGYILVYMPQEILQNPLTLFYFWEPGRSFHGGLVGVLVCCYFFAKQQNKNFLEIMDFIAPAIPLGIAFGRIGNFINGELWGRVTTVPWGMVFPHVDNNIRHPSQLYQCFLEGGLLLLIMLIYSSKKRPKGAISGMFLLYYGIFRAIAEFWREPDSSHGYIAFDWLTMGQLLCIPMILLGLFLLFRHKVFRQCTNT